MNRRPSAGLAARIMRTTFLVGAATVFAAGVVAMVTTARLSSKQVEGHDLATARIIDDRVEGRLTIAADFIDGLQAQLASASGTQQIDQVLDTVVGTRDPVFRRVVVLSESGVLLGSSEEASRVINVSSWPAYRRTMDKGAGLCLLRGDHGWELWMCSVSVDRSPALVILGEIDMQFLRTVLDAASGESQRKMMIVVNGEPVVETGASEAPALVQAIWRADSEHSGTLTVLTPSGEALAGQWVDLPESETLGWRLVAISAPRLTLAQALRTVAPSVAVLLVGVALWLGAAWTLSFRIVQPLKELERAAKQAASGSLTKPIKVTGDDEVSRVAEAFNQVGLRLNSLHDLSQLLATTSQLDQVLDGILTAVDHLVGPGVEAIYLVDNANGLLVPVRVTGILEHSPTSIPLDGDYWLVRALRSSETLALSALPSVMSKELPGLAGTYGHALAAPLVAGNEPLGVVVALRDAERPLSDAEREMVRTFSAQAAVAVQSSRLFETESRSRRVAETLRTVAEELVRPEALESSILRVQAIVADLFGASTVRILVLDRASVALAGEPAEEDANVLAAGLKVLEAYGSGDNPVHLSRASDPRFDQVFEELAADELLVVPVGLDTDHGAVAIIARSVRDGRPILGTENSLQAARAVSDELALAFDNAYFYERALSRASDLETVFRISQAVSSSLKVNVVLNRVLDVVQRLLTADSVVLLEYDEARRLLTTSMARGEISSSLLHLEIAPGQDVAGRVFSSGSPVVLRGLEPGVEGMAGGAAANGMRSLLAVPLLARGRPIGVLLVFSRETRGFADQDVSMVQTFATQSALAIDTARLYGREHEVASVLQRSILPEELPDFPEIDAGSVYAPAGSEAEIGGDYYDLFRTPTGETWFAIGDVCGKGVKAATRTSVIKYTLRALAAAGMMPGRMLGELNRMLTESGQPNEIVTVWVGRIDESLTRLSWASGGHPPGLLRSEDGHITTLDATGPLLGALAGVTYEESSVDLGRGDRILLYTDGVTEARSGNIFFGEERVREVFCRQGTAQSVADDLLDEVRRYARSDLRDDVAVLVVGLKTGSKKRGQHT